MFVLYIFLRDIKHLVQISYLGIVPFADILEDQALVHEVLNIVDEFNNMIRSNLSDIL